MNCTLRQARRQRHWSGPTLGQLADNPRTRGLVVQSARYGHGHCQIAAQVTLACSRMPDDNPEQSVDAKRPRRVTTGVAIEPLLVATGQTGNDTLMQRGHLHELYQS
jgi:hypothetical protein